jgi:hypothetical protein
MVVRARVLQGFIFLLAQGVYFNSCRVFKAREKGIAIMSSIFIHVFTKDSDFYVADNSAGDAILEQLARTNPETEVIVKDRDTDEVLVDRQPLSEFLAG